MLRRRYRLSRSSAWVLRASRRICFNSLMEASMRKPIAATLIFVCVSFLALAADRTADLKKADQDWARSAIARNVDQFMSFVGDDAYACGLDGKWAHGKDAIKAEWTKMLSDPSFKLNWTVESAEVSKDGGCGYTRGTSQGGQGSTSCAGSDA